MTESTFQAKPGLNTGIWYTFREAKLHELGDSTHFPAQIKGDEKEAPISQRLEDWIMSNFKRT